MCGAVRRPAALTDHRQAHRQPRVEATNHIGGASEPKLLEADTARLEL